MTEENKRPRNAGVKQDRNSVAVNERTAFDNLGLTKRNAEYMYRFNKALGETKLSADKKAETTKSMVQELLDAQKGGQTARNLYGDVATHVKLVVDGPERTSTGTGVGRDDYLPNAFYNGLVFFAIFNIMFGIMYLTTPKLESNPNSSIGITSIVISSVVAGLIMPLIPDLFDPRIKHRFNWVIRMIFLVLGFVVWMFLFYITKSVAAAINPVLPAWPSIGLGAVSVVAMIFVRRQFHIRGGLFG